MNTFMNESFSRRLAWSVTWISVALVTIGLTLSILALVADGGPSAPFSHQFFTPVLTLAYGVAGALVLSQFGYEV